MGENEQMEVEKDRLKRELDFLGNADYREIFIEVSSKFEIRDRKGRIKQQLILNHGSSARTIIQGQEAMFSSPSLYPQKGEVPENYPNHDLPSLVKLIKELREKTDKGEITVRSFKRKVFVFNDEGLKQKEESFISVKMKDGDVILRWASPNKRPAVDFLYNEFKTRIEERKKTRPLPKEGEISFLVEGEGGGTLIHEIFWHPLELDFILEENSPFSVEDLGRKITSEEISIYSKGKGIDDEGSELSLHPIVEEGILASFPSSRLTSLVSGLPLVPHGRRENYHYPTLVRPLHTVVLPGKESYLELLSRVKEGCFITEFSGGEIDLKSKWAYLTVSRGYWIEKGRVKFPLKPFLVAISLPLLEGEISVGAESFVEEGLFCHKRSQVVRYSSETPNFMVKGYGKSV